ncbi:GNAT family N-acetyltransferase [Paenibacillus rigui]|uniref:RimJ/RimL family protein N-acetyltransferase n=1 Tax=Paenibacillus rigui TaxID=554312 RepID=A0A229UHI7_9BACL|nr:GNAT family protein [Paenibacillus rigui]OXM82862.1 RimJ/RimL family protein N-acetyltransferase [Paenibacillus rigui]
MFIYKIDEELSLRLIELRDAERIFELTNKSRSYLREWLPWLNNNLMLEDTLGLSKTADVGYWLAEEFQGNGIMTKVAKALTDHAFHDLSLNKVEIRAAAGNKKSRRIPERLNFVNEGRIRQAEWLYDHFVDHIIYGILAAEWQE